MEDKIKNFLRANIKKGAFLWETLILFKKLKVTSLIKYLACKRWLKIKSYELYFKYFYKNAEGMVKIIVADFGNYSLYREKNIHGNVIKCGIGNLFENMTKFKAGAYFDVILVINLSDNTEEKKSVYNLLQEKYPFIEKVIFRDNTGHDFGAYNRGYEYLRSIDYKGDVLFMNSSSSGPSHDYWLLKYLYLFHRKKQIGLCGSSINSSNTNLTPAPFKPHVQGFFMYTNVETLTDVFNDSLPGSDITSGGHIDVIVKGEIEFSQRIIDNGYGICSMLFDHFIYYKGSKWNVPFGDTRYNEIYNQFANKI
jgi:hypothetical protein